MQGTTAGLVFAIYAVGQLTGSFFAAPITDRLGRRAGMFAGAILIIVGAVFQSIDPNIHQFMGGRYLLGFGAAVGGTAGPIYVV